MILFWEWIKKNHPQVYLEECKYKIKKTHMPKFIKTELKSDSHSDLDLELEKIEAKINNVLESGSDYDSVYDPVHSFFYLHGWLQIKMILKNNKSDSHKLSDSYK